MAELAPHPAYTESDTPARVLIAAVDNPEFRKSWSKADNIAKAIYEVVDRRQTIPIRFPLGTGSFGMLRDEVDTIAKEFDEIKSISIGVDTDEQAAPLTEYKRFA